MLKLIHPSMRRLSHWLDGTLSETAAERVAAHVAQCPRCQARLRPLRAMEPAFMLPPASGLAGDSSARRARIMGALTKVERIEAPTIGEVREVVGVVLIERAGCEAGDPLEAFAGLALKRGDNLRALGDSMALIALADGSHFYINKNTELEFRSGEAQAWLGAGELLAMMRPQERPYRIKTPSATLAVLGTDFDAAVMPDARTVLSVLKGRVAFENAAGKAVVARRRQVAASAHTRPAPALLRDPGGVGAWARPLAASVELRGGGVFMSNYVKWLAAIAITLLILVGVFLTFFYPKLFPRAPLIPGRVNPATGEKLLSENDVVSLKRQIFPQDVIDVAWTIHEAALQRPLGPGERPIPVNTQLNAIGPDKAIWLGVLSLYVNQSDSIISGEIYRNDTSSKVLYYFDEQENALPVRLQKDTTKPYQVSRIFVTLRNPIPPRNSRRHFYMTNHWLSLMALPGNRYSGRLQNHFGSEVLETLTLVLPKGWSLEVASEQPMSMQQIGDFTLLAWQKRVPKNTDHTVIFTLIENTAVTRAAAPAAPSGAYVSSTASSYDLYRQIPRDAIAQVVEWYRWNQTTAGNDHSNVHVYIADHSPQAWMGLFHTHLNKTAAPEKEFVLGSTRDPGQRAIFDMSGTLYGYREAPEPGEDGRQYYRQIVVPPQPLAPGDSVELLMLSVNPRFELKPAGDKTYSLTMHNEFNGNVLESFILVLPSGLTLTDFPRPSFSSLTNNYSAYMWTQRQKPGDPRHTVIVNLAVNTSRSTANAALRAAQEATQATNFREQPFAGMMAGIRAMTSSAEGLALMPRLARDIPGYDEAASNTNPEQIKQYLQYRQGPVDRVEMKRGEPQAGDLAYVYTRQRDVNSNAVLRTVMILEDGMWKEVLTSTVASDDVESDLKNEGLIVRNFRIIDASAMKEKVAKEIQKSPSVTQARDTTESEPSAVLEAARAALAATDFRKQPYAGMVTGIQAMKSSADLLPLMPRLLQEVPGYAEALSRSLPIDLKGRADKMNRRVIEKVEMRDGPIREGDLAYVYYKPDRSKPDMIRDVMLFEDGIWKPLHETPVRGSAVADLAQSGLVVRDFRLIDATQLKQLTEQIIKAQLERQRNK